MWEKKSLGVSNIILIILVFIVVILGAGVAYIYVNFYQKSLLPSNVNAPANVNLSKEPIKADLALAKRLIAPEQIVEEKADVQPQIPSYDLPLNSKEIANFESLTDKIKLTAKAKSMLSANGFVVIDTPRELGEKPENFADYYSNLKTKDLPIFITSDSLLHYYHIFFDTTLMKLERDLFYDDVWQISKSLFDNAVLVYNSSSGDLQEAARKEMAYLSVALELLKPKSDQISSEATLRAEYCYEGSDEEYCQMMLAGVKDQYGDKASLKYFSSAEADKYSFTAPEEVKAEVQKELDLIAAHEGFKASPIFVYKEDYSQYVARGHYTKSEKLKNYFKALMWYGRMTALITGSPILKDKETLCTGPMNGIVSEAEAKLQTLQASLIASQFSQDKNLQKLWQRMYAITAYFVGFSDDLGPYEYSQVLNNLLGQDFQSQDLADKYPQIKEELDKLTFNPKIYSGLGQCELLMPCPPLSDQELQSLKDQAKKLLAETKGFRLMGQRFTLDSYLFSEIVSPYSGKYNGTDSPLPTEEKPFTFTWDDKYGKARDSRPFTWVKTDVADCEEGREVRGFPQGMDIMALFGSERAKQIIDDLGNSAYTDYNAKFNQLKQEIDALPRDVWFSNLYWNWLYVLQGLNVKPQTGYQSFMQTDAWLDKELNTTLASWTELRHDTILYVKQSYTMAEMGAGPEPTIVGYVEPVPEFYARLLTLTKMTNLGLQNLVPTEEMDSLKIKFALDAFEEILTKLLDMSEKELANTELSEDEYNFIKNFGDSSKNLIEIVSGGDVDPDIFKTTMVADVHTEGNVKMALEEGVGYIKTLLAAYKLPDNSILVGVGPVFSYYEFKQPMADRLTDEKWREMLSSKDYPPQPEWTKSFSE